MISLQDLHNLYQVKKEDQIGKGASASVFRAVRKKDGKVVVIKECLLKEGKTEHCKNEWQMIKSIKPHPNIISFYDFYQTPKADYIVMENCQETLLDMLHKNGALAEPVVADIIKQLLFALYHLKMNGIIHRDIKPENVAVCNGTFKLLDFGLAVAYNPFNRGRSAGTPNYIAPENVNYISPPPNSSGDMHSLGVLTYELLTGYPPYNNEDIRRVLSHIIHNNRQYDDLLKKNSAQARDFIDKLIGVTTFVLKQDERMTVEQALEHPWIKSLKKHF